jgi:hypothetical protein
MFAGANFISRNDLNKRMFDKTQCRMGTPRAGTYIDDCTTYRQLDDAMEVTSRFYDKDALLAALKQLK